MENIHLNSPESLGSLEQAEDKTHRAQLKTIFHFLQENVATASMVSAVTGIPQKNICRYKRDLELTGRLWEVQKAYCEHTGFKAWYLTTNPDNAPFATSQLSLFQEDLTHPV